MGRLYYAAAVASCGVIAGLINEMIAANADMAADTRNAWCMPSSKAAKTSGSLLSPPPYRKTWYMTATGSVLRTRGNAIAMASI